MKKIYVVSGVVIDTSDIARRFRLEIAAQSTKNIEQKARRCLHLSRHDLIRDVSVVEME